MGFHGECGRGWSARCANSKGKKCRCKCGGANHGKLAQSFQRSPDSPEVREAIEFGQRHANYRLGEDSAERLVIRDVGPWDQFPTVTTDARWVVSQLSDRLNGRRLMYYDSDGRLDELLVQNGQFAGFAPVGGAS